MTPEDRGFNPEYAEESLTAQEVSALEGEVLLEFGAPWCGHCKAAEPAVREAMAGHDRIRHIKIYDGKGKRLGRSFRVKLWPTLIRLQDGQEVARVVRPLRAGEVRELLGDGN